MAHISESQELGRDKETWSGPSCPPGFEFGFKPIGSSIQSQQKVNIPGVEFETEQVTGRSECSTSISNEIIQTPIYDSNQAVRRNYDEDVIPIEEELVEAQITWDLGKMLGLQASNEKAVIDALSKVHEIQDFVLPRKRGRPRKKTNCSKNCP